MQRGRYARYCPEALSLVKLARLRALQRGSKTCEPADVLTAILVKLPPVLTAVLSANGLVLARVPYVSDVDHETPGEKEGLKAASLVPLSRSLRRCLDWAEERAGEDRVSGCLLFKSIWELVVAQFASATRRGDSEPAPEGLKFPDHDLVVKYQMAALETPQEGVAEVATQSALAPLPAAIVAYGREMGEGPASPFVGRERELESLISVLLKYFKPNPLLLGEAGVGKTALLEALARKIKAGQVPAALRGKRLVEISVNSLLAGASFPGDMESRFEGLFEALRSCPEVILFIDEIHSLVATNRGGGTGSSAAELLKPVLSRNDLQLIGATTNAEYQRYIAPEEALARRFQPIQVEEPTAQVVRVILENAAAQLSRHHEVQIPSKLFPALIRLCAEELPSRRFPDKALDVLDRACAAASISGSSVVDSAAVERAVADLAGIPYTHSSPEFQKRMGELEAFLGERVLGQEAAAHSVANTIRLCKHRLDPRPARPDGVFLFLGPTGVGKTSMALSIAEAVCGNKDAVIRVDMGEFNNPASTNRLLGADPGYVGHDSEPALVRGLLTWHAGVLLLDEFEKAHHEVQQLFLGAFDEGRIRDAKGRSHSLSNFTVIATSNAGGHAGREVGFGGGASRGPAAEGKIPKELLSVFSAELLNRFDEVVFFKPLLESHLFDIFHNQLLRGLNERLEEDSGVIVRVREELVRKVLAQADCSRFGARELQRVFQRLVTQPVLSLLGETGGTGELDGVTVVSLP
jgi:ATP-dependent Clp protease ATP-binding subunit ClpC